MVARYGSFLIRRSDFPEADRSLGANRGMCPVQLSMLVVLQRQHGWTDRETVRRAGMDLQVKACLGMGLEQPGPSQPTLCRHRSWMQELGLDTLYMERVRDRLEALELVGDTEPVVVDSVPIEGAGQQLDSYNLLAGAIRKGLRALARAQQRPMEHVAGELGLGLYLNRSAKGHADVQWDNDASRTAFLARLVADAQRIRQLLAPANRPDGENLPHLAGELAERGIEPAWWGGDHAYGTLANHRYFQTLSEGELVARMPDRPMAGA